MFFRGALGMSACKLALQEHAPDLFGFSTPAQQVALMQAMGMAAGPAPRVADTLTVYSVSSRAAAVIDSRIQFFAV